MKRLFTKRQRLFIARSAEWECEICSISLDNSFHADHIIPFSKGGKTEVSNAQALCRECNLQKGNKMSNVVYRKHQLEMIEKANLNFEKGKSLFCDIAPGGGKTIGALGIYEDIKSAKSKLLVIVPTKALISQWKKEAHELFNIDLIEGYSDNNRAFKESDGFVMTYAGVVTKAKDLYDICSLYDVTVVFDEIHHLSDSETASWGVAAKEAFNSVTKKVLLTGTPWKHNGFDVLWLERDVKGNAVVDVNVPKNELVGKSLRWTQFTPSIPKSIESIDCDTGEITVHESMASAKKTLGVSSIYGKVIRIPQNIKNLFSKADKKLTSIRSADISTNSAGGLIVCADTKHARKIQEDLERLSGIKYPIVHSDMNKPHDVIKEFKEGNTKWIIAVDMIAEGIDIPRLQVIIYLSAKTTSLWIWQVVGRAERLKKHQVGKKVAETAYFYYYSGDEDLDKAIAEIIEEQKKAHIVSDTKFTDTDHETLPSVERPSLPFQLRDFETEDGDIKIGDNVYKIDDPVTTIALAMYENDPAIRGYNFELQYKFANTVYQMYGSPKNTNEDNTVVPPSKSEQRDIIRKQMTATLNAKMKPYMHKYGNRVGECFKKVNSHLNKKAGISNIDDASLDDLEKRYEILRDLRIENVRC